MTELELDKRSDITPLKKLYDKGIITHIKKRLVSKKREINKSSIILKNIDEEKVAVCFAYYILNYNPILNEKIDTFEESFLDEININFELLFSQFIELYEAYLSCDNSALTKKYKLNLKKFFTSNTATKKMEEIVNNKKFEDAIRIYFMNNDIDLSDIGVDNTNIEEILTYFYNDLVSLMKTNKLCFIIELNRLKNADISLAKQIISDEIEFILKVKDSIAIISKMESEKLKLMNYIALISDAQIESMENLERVRKLREEINK